MKIPDEILKGMLGFIAIAKYAQDRQTEQKWEDVNARCAELYGTLRVIYPGLPSLEVSP